LFSFVLDAVSRRGLGYEPRARFLQPGLYDPAIGGFRHSDTVVVTEDGVDVLTNYPSDIESLTLPV
jgi:hypothetical protein